MGSATLWLWLLNPDQVVTSIQFSTLLLILLFSTIYHDDDAPRAHLPRCHVSPVFLRLYLYIPVCVFFLCILWQSIATWGQKTNSTHTKNKNKRISFTLEVGADVLTSWPQAKRTTPLFSFLFMFIYIYIYIYVYLHPHKLFI